MSGNPLKALIVVTSAGSMPLMRYIGSRFSIAGRPFAYLYMGAEDERFGALSASAAESSVEAISFEKELATQVDTNLKRGFAVKPTFIRLLAKAWKVEISPGVVQAIRMQLATASTILKKVQPDAVIVAENGISGPIAFLSRVQASGIPIITVPYGNARPHDIEIDLERKRLAGERLEPSGQEHRLIRLMMNPWIKKGREAGATMFQPGYIIALEAAGVSLENPWIVQGGPMNVLCAESRNSVQQYLVEGMPREKIRLTGSPYCDEMAESIQQDPAAASAFFQPNTIEPGRLKLLVSWPPDYHATHIGKNEFSSYQEMSARYFSFLRRLPNCELTVSLHPSAGIAGEGVMRDSAISPAREHLVGLIPRHDIFITFFSSATRWAIAAGKPVVNIDLYDQRLPNFTHLGGVVHTTSLQHFSSVMTELATSPQAYSRLAAMQIAVAPDFGIMDGQCVARIASEIDRLTANRKV